MDRRKDFEDMKQNLRSELKQKKLTKRRKVQKADKKESGLRRAQSWTGMWTRPISQIDLERGMGFCKSFYSV